jgi:hypothetical protein
MGDVENRTACRFLGETGFAAPLSADEALRAARLFPAPCSGPATLTGTILRHDRSRSGWEAEVWSLVCGLLLRQDGEADTAQARAELARALGSEETQSSTMGMGVKARLSS